MVVLDWSGFVANSPNQTASAIWAIRILVGPVPSQVLLAGILFTAFYPLTRESHADTSKQDELRKRP